MGKNKELKRLALSMAADDSKPSANSIAKKLFIDYDGAMSEENFKRMVRGWISKERKSSDVSGVLAEECEAAGIDPADVNYFWYKNERISINARNSGGKSVADIGDEIISRMVKHSPSFPKIKREVKSDSHLLVIDPADVHIGKLCSALESGEDYNSQIAVKRVRDGVNGILEKASGFNIDKILYIIGNDKLHIDSPKRQTTSGTSQDTDGMWYENFLMAFQIDIEMIELCMSVAPVHVQYDPSNHDYMTGFFLAQAIQAWFRKCGDVTFNTSISHRKYFQYGSNLIGTSHGDGAKVQDLPLLMAQEAPREWSESKHRYFYIHHIHHKTSKDFGSVCVESLRSPSGTDSWHHRNGYQHAPKAIEGYVHHPTHGQIARLTHIF